MDTVLIVQDFLKAAALAGTNLRESDITVEVTKAPHRPPSRLPPGKMAVYVFSHGTTILKVGKAGPNSAARYTSQHYNAASAPSTLAASLMKEGSIIGIHGLSVESAGNWIKQNTDRTNFLLRLECGIPILTLLEAFLQCKLKPKFEGFSSQR
jgi:predicted Zn-dependent protease